MKHLTYATVCSGIECMSAAVIDLPMMPVFFAEIEPFPCAVLKSHFPTIPNLGDMSQIKVSNDGKEITNGSVRIVLDARLDILAGGTPCQDVSVAGKRGGMQEGSGTRSSLAFQFVRLVRELRPRYVLWENVAGVLSDRSFPEFLGALAECGYGVAYRTLDAQWVRCADIHHKDGRVVDMERAIPQRRRRVWVVGCSGGDVSRSAQILFEHEGTVRDTPPSRITRKEVADLAQGRNRVHDRLVGGAPGGGECLNPLDPQAKRVYVTNGASPCLNSGTTEGANIQPSLCIALDGDKLKPRENPRKGGNGFGINEDGASYTLTVPDRHGVAYGIGNGQVQGACTPDTELSKTLDCMHDHQAVVECYENHAQDSRVKPIEVAPTIPQKAGTGGNNLPLAVFNKVSHARGKDGEGERWAEDNVASTRNVFDIGETRTQECVVTHQPAKEVLDLQGGKIGAHYTEDNSAPTLTHGRGSASDIYAVTMVSTNSNGEDVMPTISACEGKQGQQQKDVGGGYILHKRADNPQF